MCGKTEITTEQKKNTEFINLSDDINFSVR